MGRVTTAGIRGAVFIGVSVDGYIAKPDGDLEWLTARGDAAGDTGYAAFMATVDGVVLGRKTYEVAASFPQWPYAELPVLVLSNTLGGDDSRVEICRCVDDLVRALRLRGITRPYIDGGAAIRACLAAGLVERLTVTAVPVLIGRGAMLFGPLTEDVALSHVATTVLPAGLVQTTWTVDRPSRG